MLNIVKKAKHYDQLKKLVIDAIQDGKDMKLDLQRDTYGAGQYFVYEYLLNQISKMEGENKNIGLIT